MFFSPFDCNSRTFVVSKNDDVLRLHMSRRQMNVIDKAVLSAPLDLSMVWIAMANNNYVWRNNDFLQHQLVSRAFFQISSVNHKKMSTLTKV